MQFNLTINCDNAAFQDSDEFNDITASYELARILEKVQAKVSGGIFEAIVRDTNGNTVGTFELVEG